jgi:hypothetical protein
MKGPAHDCEEHFKDEFGSDWEEVLRAALSINQQCPSGANDSAGKLSCGCRPISTSTLHTESQSTGTNRRKVSDLRAPDLRLGVTRLTLTGVGLRLTL